MLMPMLSPDSFTAFVRLAIWTSADQPVSALPLDPIDGEVALNVAAFARMATPLLPESLLQFIAGPMGFEPTASSVTSWRSNQLELRPQRRDSFSLRALPVELPHSMAARTGLEPATSVLTGHLRVAVTTSKIQTDPTHLNASYWISVSACETRTRSQRLSTARSSIERYALSVLNTALEDRLELPT